MSVMLLRCAPSDEARQESTRERVERDAADSKARHARTIPIERAMRWRWHLDADARIRLAMAARMPDDSAELAYLLHDADDQVCAMAHERSKFANYEKACMDERWFVRQVGVARTSSIALVRAAVDDPNDFVRETARRRLFGARGVAFVGKLVAIISR